MIRKGSLLRALIIGLALSPIIASAGCSILYAVDDYASTDDGGTDADASDAG